MRMYGKKEVLRNQNQSIQMMKIYGGVENAVTNGTTIVQIVRLFVPPPMFWFNVETMYWIINLDEIEFEHHECANFFD